MCWLDVERNYFVQSYDYICGLVSLCPWSVNFIRGSYLPAPLSETGSLDTTDHG